MNRAIGSVCVLGILFLMAAENSLAWAEDAPATPQEPNSIVVKVADQSGQPISAMGVEVWDGFQGGAIAQGKTDAGGQCILRHFKPGKYLIRVPNFNRWVTVADGKAAESSFVEGGYKPPADAKPAQSDAAPADSGLATVRAALKSEDSEIQQFGEYAYSYALQNLTLGSYFDPVKVALKMAKARKESGPREFGDILSKMDFADCVASREKLVATCKAIIAKVIESETFTPEKKEAIATKSGELFARAFLAHPSSNVSEIDRLRNQALSNALNNQTPANTTPVPARPPQTAGPAPRPPAASPPRQHPQPPQASNDDSAKFVGTWKTTVSIGGQPADFISVNDGKQFTNYLVTPNGRIKAMAGTFTAKSGKYKSKPTTGQPPEEAQYKLVDDDTLQLVFPLGTVTWKRTQ